MLSPEQISAFPAVAASPAQAGALVRGAGLEVAEHLTPLALYDRYFAGRSDGLRPSAAERLIAARAGLPDVP